MGRTARPPPRLVLTQNLSGVISCCASPAASIPPAQLPGRRRAPGRMASCVHHQSAALPAPSEAETMPPLENAGLSVSPGSSPLVALEGPSRLCGTEPCT